MRENKSTNPELIKLIRSLKKQSREKDAKIWLDVADNLARSRRQRIAVNLSRISRQTQRSDTVIVPGKILATGSLNHSLTIAAFDLSEPAKAKLKAAKAKFLSIPELMEKNPAGSNVKIIR